MSAQLHLFCVVLCCFVFVVVVVFLSCFIRVIHYSFYQNTPLITFAGC